MLHLTDERLAALADSEPDAREAGHLAACGRCAAAREAQRRLLAMAAAARGHIGPPLTNWDAIAARLRAEGMLVGEGEVPGPLAAVRPAMPPATTSAGPSGDAIAGTRGRGIRQWGFRAAAAVVLMGGGALAGRMSGEAASSRAADRADESPSAATAEAATRTAFPGAPSEQYPMYADVNEALRAMEVAQMQYQYAATFIAQRDTSGVGTEDAYRARLAALDQIAATSRAALYRAPHDPVLNQYYLSALGAREATVSQLGVALRGGARVARY